MDRFADFIAAQEGVWPEVTAELSAGRKTTHWIWFVFPQLARLGRSSTARRFGLSGRMDAQAYLRHPLLGPRLVEAAELMMTHAGADPETILGGIDSLKLRSSMTLFEAVPDAPEVFSRVLRTFYGGSRCPLTRAALEAS